LDVSLPVLCRVVDGAGEGKADAGAASEGGVDFELGTQGSGAGGEIVESVSAGHGGGIEASSVVAHDQVRASVGQRGETDLHAAGGSVAEGVADGFPDDLQQLRAGGIAEN